MPTPDIAAQDYRPRATQRLLIGTSLLLLTTFIGWQITSVEDSRVRPEYFGEGHFEPSKLAPIPWISTLGITVILLSLIGLVTIWTITVSRLMRSQPRLRQRPSTANLNRPSNSFIDIAACWICPFILAFLSAAYLLTIIWYVFHYFRVEDFVWTRGSKLFFAEEIAAHAGIPMILLVPGNLILLLLVIFGSLQRERRQSIGLQSSRFSPLAVVIGTLLLALTWCFFLSASRVILRHSSDHWYSESYAKSPEAIHDGLLSAAMFVLAAWTVVFGSWLIFSAAVYELFLVKFFRLSIRPAVDPASVAARLPIT